MIVRSRQGPRLTRVAAWPAAAAILVAACGDATAPVPTDGPPRELTYVTYGFIATSVAVHLAGDTLVWVSRRGSTDSTMVRRVPSSDDWREFWRTVNVAGVPRWPASCTNHMPDVGGFGYSLAWSGTRRTGTDIGTSPTRTGACSTRCSASAPVRSASEARSFPACPFPPGTPSPSKP